MTRFLEFESHEDMMKFMAERTAAANAGLHPGQQAIDYNDHWVRFTLGHPIEYGHVAEIADLADTEDSASLVHIMERHVNGFLYGLAYSTYAPHGEWGETHRADVWPISEELFDHAQTHGWTTQDMEEWAVIEVRVARHGFVNHNLAQAD